MPLSPWLQGPKGRIHPGVLVLLGDSALTAAVLTALPPGVVFSTAELSMTFLGELPPPGGELRAVASVLHTEPRHGLAVADLLGPSGERLGFGTARVFLQPPLDVSGLPPFSPTAPEAAWPTPDPWARDLEEELPPLAGHGLLDLDATRAGGRPRPAIDRLIGIRVEAVNEGEVTFTMPASQWLANELGTVSGGMLGLLAHSATSAAGQSVARPGSPYRALDVKINFLEQVEPDGEPISATGRAIHRGRLVVANTEVSHSGKLVATATGSTVLGS
jgi:acyl-CoA thioesterase